MSGYWQCQGCQGRRVARCLLAVGGGLQEARQLTCEDCGERDQYTLRLIAGEGPHRTARGRFQWVKGSVEEGKP